MSKVKSSTKPAKASKSDVLTKVKDAAVTKPSTSVKSKSKEVAKQVATKEEKKSKKSKKVKEPTPEPESESSESSSSEEDSASESEEETKPTNQKVNGTHKAAESSDESEESSEDEAPTNGVLGKAPAVTEVESDESSDESSEDEKPAKPVKAATKPVAKEESSDESDADSEDEKPTAAATKDESDSDESDDSSESEAEAEVKPKTAKRKAEADAEPVVKKTKTDDSSAQSANLFVGNLSWNVDEAWLKETFEEHGEISRVQLMTDRATGRSKGFGYVEFVNAEDAAAAHAAKQGAELDNRAMNVDFANARQKTDQADRRKSYGDQVSEPSDTLFLGNLSFDCGQETVTEAFSPHGTILGIRLPTDRETGQPKGFGYVTFSSIDEAKGALEAMQGGYVAGRPVRLDYSQPRPQNGDSPARGRGGFGGGRGGGRGRGGFGDRGGRGGGGRGRGGFDRGGRGGRGGSTNRGGFGDFSGRKVSFD